MFARILCRLRTSSLYSLSSGVLFRLRELAACFFNGEFEISPRARRKRALTSES